MMQQNSTTFQRWMGTHALVVLTLAADFVGAYASFLLGQYVLPLYAIALGDVLGFLSGIADIVRGVLGYIGGSLQAVGGNTFLLFLGVGALFGLLFGIMVATRGRYGDVEFVQGVVAFLSTVMVAVLLWCIYGLVKYGHPIHSAFTYPPAYLASNVISGWVCLTGYILVHLICYFVQNAPKLSLSRAHPGGPKQQHIEQCFQAYHTAILRFNPRPVLHLNTPKDICFHEGESKEITWDGQALVVPEVLMHPENEWHLRAVLGRQIGYFNMPDLHVQQFLNSYPRNLGLSLALIFAGNFLILPTLVQDVAGARWRGERILDADRYAFLIGQGVFLRHLLWQEREEQRQAGTVDEAFPTLSERIEQLDALIDDEHQQMYQLGIPLQQQVHRESVKTT